MSPSTLPHSWICAVLASACPAVRTTMSVAIAAMITISAEREGCHRTTRGQRKEDLDRGATPCGIVVIDGWACKEALTEEKRAAGARARAMRLNRAVPLRQTAPKS